MKEGQVDFQGDPTLQEKIDKLKDPTPYQEKFKTPEVQQLSQAIEILGRLQQTNFGEVSSVGYHKVMNAKMYLDELLKQQFDAPEEEKTE